VQITQGQVYIDDIGDKWYIEKAPTKDAMGVVTFVGNTDTDTVIKLHVGIDGTILATGGKLMKQVNNVIDIFSKRQPQQRTDNSDGESSIEALFKEAMERNKNNRKRQESERSKTNKTTMRSYNIKKKD
jgi:hypothetical protein